MLRKKGVLVLLVILAILAILPACDSLNRQSESPVGVESILGTEKGDDIQKALSSDPRTAVVLECYYALRPYCSSAPYKSIFGNAVSEWNYLCSDLNAYRVLKGWYGTAYSSVWSLFYIDPPWSYGCYNGIGRGGQCRYFANLILYRSGVYQRCLPAYTSAGLMQIRFARPGDVIQRTSGCRHTAVVVKVLEGIAGYSVTRVDVIDSNFVGGDGQEIIGMHQIGGTDLSNYAVITGIY